MTIQEIEEIQEEIEGYKRQRAVADSKIEEIEAIWKKEFGVSTLKEAMDLHDSLKTKLEKLSEKEEALQEEFDSLLEELENATR